MFNEHDFMVWGMDCSCGTECYILQNKHHPWTQCNYKIKIACKNCNRSIEIDQKEASIFYNNKIYSYYDELDGTVLDIGCGSGFLTKHIIDHVDVTKVYAIDQDIRCKPEIEKLNRDGKKLEFQLLDIKEIGEKFNDSNFVYIISRDVFMFIDDTSKYFDNITSLTRKGIRQMSWYINNTKMNNSLHPDQIVEELISRGWTVEYEPLDWYLSGYYIRADK